MDKKRFQHTQTAQAMLEFALILPLLLFIILGIFAFGHFMFVYSTTASASREGARYGSAVGLSENNLPRFEDCVAVRAAAMRVGSFGGLREENIKVFFYDETTSVPDPTDAAHLVGRCQDNAGNNVNTIVYYDPDGAGTQPARTVGLGDRIEIRLHVDYVPLVPFVTLPSFPVNSFSVRTILRNVTIGTAPPVTSPGGGEDPSKGTLSVSVSTDASVDLSDLTVGQNIPVTWTVTDTDSTNNPTGTMTVSLVKLDGSQNTCTGTVAPSGSCTLVGGADWAALATDDSHVALTLSYPGDANFNSYTGVIPVTVRYVTTTTLERIWDTPPAIPGDSTSPVNTEVRFRIKVTRTPGLSAQVQYPAGSIYLYQVGNATPIWSGTTNPSGDWWVTSDDAVLTFTTAGVKSLYASYVPAASGNGPHFKGSYSTPNLTHTVTASFTPVVAVSAPSTAVMGQAVNVVVTFSSLGGGTTQPTGSVVITDLTSGNVQEGTLSGGTVTIPMTMTMPSAAGNPHTLQATYVGDSIYNQDISDNFIITVYKGPTRVRLTGPSAQVGQGQDVTFSWTVEAISPAVAPAGQPTGGTVTLITNDGGTTRTCTGGAPTGTCVIRFSTIGSKTVTASYDGVNDSNFNASTADTVTHVDQSTFNVVACPVFTAYGWKNQGSTDYFYFDLVNADNPITVTSVEIGWPSTVANPIYLGQAHLITITSAGQTDTPNYNCNNNNDSCIWEKTTNNTLPRFCIGAAGCSGTVTRTDPFFDPAASWLTIPATTPRRFLFTTLSNQLAGNYDIRVNFTSTSTTCTSATFTSNTPTAP